MPQRGQVREPVRKGLSLRETGTDRKAGMKEEGNLSFYLFVDPEGMPSGFFIQ
jgi:hypothetical protein